MQAFYGERSNVFAHHVRKRLLKITDYEFIRFDPTKYSHYIGKIRQLDEGIKFVFFIKFCHYDS